MLTLLSSHLSLSVMPHSALRQIQKHPSRLLCPQACPFPFLYTLRSPQCPSPFTEAKHSSPSEAAGQSCSAELHLKRDLLHALRVLHPTVNTKHQPSFSSTPPSTFNLSQTPTTLNPILPFSSPPTITTHARTHIHTHTQHKHTTPPLINNNSSTRGIPHSPGALRLCLSKVRPPLIPPC